MRAGGRFILMALGLVAGLAPAHPGGSGGLSGQVPKHNCSFCHDLHGGGYSQLTQRDVNVDLCQACHSEVGPDFVDRDGVQVAVPKGPFGIHDGSKHASLGRDPTGCWDCHNHEGEAGTNLSMIQQNMPTPLKGIRPVLFLSRGTGVGENAANSFADGDATYDGVCEVCHTATDQHRWDGSAGAHNAGATCTLTCHTHEAGFAGAGGGCTGCHASAQDNGDGVPPGGRRAVVSEFDRTSHHVDWASLPNGSAPDSIPDADCETCHDQTNHQSGYVWLKDPDGGASIQLMADPRTSATEAAKLEPFCLGCHDANGAGGSPPFSDGVAPVEIVDSLWASASHNTDGGYTCWDCHDNGHGSEKRNLLAPSNVAATPPANSEEEEGFCLACHDSDGPASSDIATAFDEPINWVQTATGLGNNANLNDRHDVQYGAQNRSGAVIECVSCHSPHADSGSRPYILDPDPSDGHSPGTDYYFYSATADTLSEFCLDCHDGSYGPGVTDQSTAITDIAATWGSDGMGARTSSSVDLRSGTGYGTGETLACWTCHTPHVRVDADLGTTTLFSVVDTLKNKAGTDYLFYQGRRTNDPQIFAYGITDNLDKSDVSSGAYWCNTCHNRYSMTGKENCYACHRHGDGGRF